MFDKLKDQLEVCEIRQEQAFNREEIEQKVLFNNYINNVQNILLQR